MSDAGVGDRKQALRRWSRRAHKITGWSGSTELAAALVLLVCRVDGRDGSHEVPCFKGRLPLGYSRFGDARPRPSPNREWRLYGSKGNARSREELRTTSAPPPPTGGYQTGTSVPTPRHARRQRRGRTIGHYWRSLPFDAPGIRLSLDRTQEVGGSSPPSSICRTPAKSGVLSS